MNEKPTVSATFHIIIVSWGRDDAPLAEEIDRASEAIWDVSRSRARITDFYMPEGSYNHGGGAFAIADRLLTEEHRQWIKSHWETFPHTRFGHEADVPVDVS